MINLFGEYIILDENTDHIPELKKMIKEKKPDVWDIYKIDEYEEFTYLTVCAKSHGHAKYIYSNYIGCDFVEASVGISKVHALSVFVREEDKGTVIDIHDDYWDDCFQKAGGYHEYDDQKITIKNAISRDIDLDFVIAVFPSKKLNFKE